MKLKELKERYPTMYISYMADFKRNHSHKTEFDNIYNFLDRLGYSIAVNIKEYDGILSDKHYPIVKHNGEIKEFKAHLSSFFKAKKDGVEFALNHAEYGWYE